MEFLSRPPPSPRRVGRTPGAIRRPIAPVVLFLVLLQSGTARGSGPDVPFRSFDHLSTQAGLVGGGVGTAVKDRDAVMTGRRPLVRISS